MRTPRARFVAIAFAALAVLAACHAPLQTPAAAAPERAAAPPELRPRRDPPIAWTVGCGNPRHPRGLPEWWDAPGAAAVLIGEIERFVALRKPTPAAPMWVALHMPHGYRPEDGPVYTPGCWTALNRHARAELPLLRAWRAKHPEVRILVYTGLDPAQAVGEWLPWIEQGGVDGFVIDTAEHRHLVRYRANLDAHAAATGDDLSGILIGGEPITLRNPRGDAGAVPSGFRHDGPDPLLADRRFFYVLVGRYYRQFVNEPLNGPLKLPAAARVHLWQEHADYAAEAAAAARAGCIVGWSGHIVPAAARPSTAVSGLTRPGATARAGGR